MVGLRDGLGNLGLVNLSSVYNACLVLTSLGDERMPTKLKRNIKGAYQAFDVNYHHRSDLYKGVTA